MSFHIETCQVCGCNFGDFDGFFCDCDENNWCSEECALKGGCRYDPQAEEEWSCPYCRHEDIDDATLLRWLLKDAGLTRKEAVDGFLGISDEEAENEEGAGEDEAKDKASGEDEGENEGEAETEDDGEDQAAGTAELTTNG